MTYRLRMSFFLLYLCRRNASRWGKRAGYVPFVVPRNEHYKTYKAFIDACFGITKSGKFHQPKAGECNRCPRICIFSRLHSVSYISAWTLLFILVGRVISGTS